MTELRIEPYNTNAAPLGEENPLPVYRGAEDDSNFTLAENVPEEDRKYFGWRTAFRVLPYRMQDGYTRDRQPAALDSIILENEHLKATFLPQWGGKLMSLWCKPEKRELLHHNPVIQPANLALRNAWTSGGIEWNCGQLGHHYLTCSPVFAARVKGSGGLPVLRLYAWERIKRVCWYIDFHLPENSPFLFARFHIVNPHDCEVPMYWWTNIAVDEAEDVRVLAPAETALHNAPEGIALAALPDINGTDVTYSLRNDRSCEYFFRIPKDRRKWVATVDSTGTGFVQTSTDRLRGRKFFCWGNTPGGRHWQEYLAEPGHAYLEIQAGLAQTQLESLPMPPNTEWHWVEAFGPIHVEPEQAHESDWTAATNAAEGALEKLLPREEMDQLERTLGPASRRTPVEILFKGSGWAALERLRQDKHHESQSIPERLIFAEDTLSEEQRPWLKLLEEGQLPARSPEDGPGHFMIQEQWRSPLESALEQGKGDHWLSWYHLGVMRLEARDAAGATEAFTRSMEKTPTAWALRDLALLAKRAGNAHDACRLMHQAWNTGPQTLALAVEYADMLLGYDRLAELDRFLDALPVICADDEHIRITGAKCALRQGRYKGVEGLFDKSFAAVREGERTLADLWFRYHELRLAEETGTEIDDALRERVRREFPPPYHIDFRTSL